MKPSAIVNKAMLAELQSGRLVDPDGKARAFLIEQAVRGEGRLEFRRLKPGRVVAYFRYTAPSGDRVRLPLGPYDATGKAGLTLEAARGRVRELRGRYRNGEHDLRGTRRASKAAQEAARQAELDAQAEAERLTLGALCMAYADHIERNGRISAGKVRQALQLHLLKACPKVAALPASEVTADHALEVIEHLTEAGKLREAAKIRSYLRAAFAAAINARRSPGALPALRRIGKTIPFNPVRDVGMVPGANKTRQRVLSVAELRAYWQRIKAAPGPKGALLRLHLLTGAQRIDQLARATVDDIDADAGQLLLLDPKGRRTQPREHWVPLLPEAQAAIDVARYGGRGPYVFSCTCGEAPTTSSTFAQMVRGIAAEMVKAGEAAEVFKPGDLRRTVETRLAGLGVGLEVRAHLQSHGLGGVQSRHYDRHDYADEKRAALAQLLALVDGAPATVTPIRGRSRA